MMVNPVRSSSLFFCVFICCLKATESAYSSYAVVNNGNDHLVHHESKSEILDKSTPYKNRSPVIGILTQELGEGEYAKETYVYEAYVKFIEQSGALAVPVRINQTADYYKNLFNKLNGVVFPGGAVSLTTSGYAKSAQYFFNLSKEAYNRGDTFPILGICLGFQQLTALVTGSDLLQRCDGQDYSKALNFTRDASQSRLFKDMPQKLYDAMGKWNLTYNNHQYCMSTKVFNDNELLSSFYKVLSTNVAEDGVEFVSSMEAYKYPFYGVQWHPEKNIYLWSDAHVNHSAEAVGVTQYISNFFVNQARQSTHRFSSLDELADAVFANYPTHFEGAPTFHNLYIFMVNETSYMDNFILWDWPKFSDIPDLGLSQFLSFLLFLLFVLTLVGLLSSLMRHRAAQNYRIVDDMDIKCPT